MPSSSKRTRERQLAKLAARRATERRRKRRQRILVIALALIVALAGVGGSLLALIGNGGGPAAQPTPTDSPTETPSATAADSECGYVESSSPTGPGGALAIPEMALKKDRDHTASMKTSMGTIEIRLLPRQAPCAVNSFVYLADQGYYDGLTFHRVVRDFVIQGGDPTGSGAGGPGYSFQDELDNDLEYGAGTLAMANSGPDTNGSQFFIVASDSGAGRLQKLYTIFGEVTEGMDVVRAINRVETVGSGRNPDQPVEPVLIESVKIETGKRG
jgi:cyclophilin family peptidyl-prolyl cis-trans isomerase